MRQRPRARLRVLGHGQPRRQERLRRLAGGGGALQPQHDHRRDHPARRERRLHKPGRVRRLRQRPWDPQPLRGRGQPEREERLRSRVRRRRGAPQPQHDHRRAHPARGGRRLHQPTGVWGGALRRRPCAQHPVLGGGQPRRQERLRRLGRQRRRGTLCPQQDQRSDFPARRNRRLHQRDGGGAVRRWPWARGRAARSRSAPTGRASTPPRSNSNAVARFNRNTTTGALTQPAGSAGCVSETGAGPCANGRGLDGAWDVAVSPNGKSVYVASLFSDAVARFNRAPRGSPVEPELAAEVLRLDGLQASCAVRSERLTPDSMKAIRARSLSAVGGALLGAAAHHCNRARRDRPPHPTRRNRRLYQPDGAGICADGHGLNGATRSRSARTERASMSSLVQRRGALQPQHDHGGDRSARRDGRLHCQTGAGACVDGHGLDGAFAVAVSADGKSVYAASFEATPWRASTATRPPGRSPSLPGQPAASARPERGPAPTAMGSTPLGVTVSRDGKSVYVASAAPTPLRGSSATRPPARSLNPPGPPAASPRRGRVCAPTAMGSSARAR